MHDASDILELSWSYDASNGNFVVRHMLQLTFLISPGQ
jgi:hypothetical protein